VERLDALIAQNGLQGAVHFAGFVPDEVSAHLGDRSFVEIKSRACPTAAILDELRAIPEVDSIRMLSPVLPVLSSRDLTAPFLTCEEMFAYNSDKDREPW